MRIPLEHFTQAPILTLSPCQDSPEPPLTIRDRVSQMLSGNSGNSGNRRYSIGSAPTSPAMQRKMAMSMVLESNVSQQSRSNLTACQLMSSSLTSFDATEVDAEYDETSIDVTDDKGPTSLPFVKKTSYFQRFSRTRLSHREPPKKPEISKPEGPERLVCMDCKEMVLQVVRAQSTARRLQFAKSLFQQQQMM